MQKITEYDNTRQSAEYNGLWETLDVQQYTGWGRQYVSTLCSRGVLPHIPGRPVKFVPAAVKEAIQKMQVGGQYGRRKPRKPAIKKAA